MRLALPDNRLRSMNYKKKKGPVFKGPGLAGTWSDQIKSLDFINKNPKMA
jgi:hypothetical protein